MYTKRLESEIEILKKKIARNKQHNYSTQDLEEKLLRKLTKFATKTNIISSES